MMTVNSIKVLCLSTACSVFVTGCIQTDAADVADPVVAAETEDLGDETVSVGQSKDLGPAFATVKPGAPVSFSHSVSQLANPGENGRIEFSISESYPEGTLLVATTGSDGLNVFGGTVEQRFDMADGARHTWSVSYSADNDGIYYVNVMASTEAGEAVMGRSYSARIEIGDILQAEPTAKNGVAAVSSEGEAEIVMEAEETIE